MDLKKMNLVELNQNEMQTVEGGSWIGDALRWVNDHILVTVADSVVGAITSIGIAFGI